MSRPTILHVTTERGWRGGERQLELLVRGLAPEFHQVVVVRPRSEAERRLPSTGAAVVPIPMRGGWDLLSALRLRRLARERGAEILHAHTSHAHALGLPSARTLGIPLVVSRRVESRPGLGRMARRKYRAPEAHFVAVSRSVAQGLAAAGVPRERIEVIPDGIDLERFPRGADPRPADAEVRFVNVAAMSPEKDQATLLQAFAVLESDDPRVRLTIAGSGPLEAELKALVASLGLERVAFAGWREDVPALLAAGDAFVLSSRREGLGSSIMEAMAAGLPVVATRVGGIPELVRDGETGTLVEPGDASGLARAMGRLAADGPLRRSMAAAARSEALSRFGAGRMVEAHAALYRRLLG